MKLANAEFGLVQHCIDALTEKLAALHLSIVIEQDFRALVDFLRASNAHNLNPTFDPAHNDLSSKAFWLRVIDEKGETVASQAQRIFETEDFCDLVQTGMLWYPNGLTLKDGQAPLRIHRPSMMVGGTVAHAGGLWVNPRFRKMGVSLYLPYLARALVLRNYEPDFITCIVLASMGKTALPMSAYGYRHVEPCASGWIPPVNRNDAIDLCYLTQAEAIEQIRELPQHPHYPVPLPVAAVQEKLLA